MLGGFASRWMPGFSCRKLKCGGAMSPISDDILPLSDVADLWSREKWPRATLMNFSGALRALGGAERLSERLNFPVSSSFSTFSNPNTTLESCLSLPISPGYLNQSLYRTVRWRSICGLGSGFRPPTLRHGTTKIVQSLMRTWQRHGFLRVSVQLGRCYAESNWAAENSCNGSRVAVSLNRNFGGQSRQVPRAPPNNFQAMD